MTTAGISQDFATSQPLLQPIDTPLLFAGFTSSTLEQFGPLFKQLGVTPPGWREACAPFGEDSSYRSIADITSPESRIKVRDFKKAMKAEAKSRTAGSLT